MCVFECMLCGVCEYVGVMCVNVVGGMCVDLCLCTLWVSKCVV